MHDNEGEHPFGDRGQLIFLGLFFIVWILDSFIFRIGTFPASAVPLMLRIAIAAFILTLGIMLVKSGHVVISGERRPDQLLTTGVFRLVRHPLYLAALMFYFGLSFSTMSIASFVLFLPIFFFYNYIATYEERLLIERFPTQYREYMARTGKWLPYK